MLQNPEIKLNNLLREKEKKLLEVKAWGFYVLFTEPDSLRDPWAWDSTEAMRSVAAEMSVFDNGKVYVNSL